MTAESAEKIRISVWVTDPASLPTNGGNSALAAAEEFNAAHPEYQVEIVSSDYLTIPGDVAKAAEQGAAPDLAEYHFTLNRAALDSLGPDGKPLYTPIDRAIAGRTEILGEPVVTHDMVPVARDYFRYAGELTSMPRTASGAVLYANMDILAKAGVTEPPRTWREVTAACQAIANLPDAPAHAVAWPNMYWFFLQAVAQQGGLIVDHDNGHSGRAEKVDLASTEMLAFVEWWKSLHRAGHFLYTGKRSDFGSCFAAFESQQAALVVSSSVDASHMLARAQRSGFRVQVAPLPYNDQVEFAGNMTGGFAFWLAAGLSPAKQDGALAFLQYLNNPRIAAEWARDHYRIPVTRSAIAVLEQEGLYRESPDLRVASDQLLASGTSPAVLGPFVGSHADIMGEITSAMHDVLADDADPAVRFAEASTRAQQILDDYNAHCDGPPRRTPRQSALVVSL